MGKERLLICSLVALALAPLLGSCGDGEGAADAGGQELGVIGYDALEAVYRQGLKPGFHSTIEGEGVEFSNSFASSEEQSRAVLDGKPASIVHLERTREMERLAAEGKVPSEWDERPYGGIANRSVIVFVVRKGNPRQIHNVGDLLDKNLDVILPDPIATVCGQWGVMGVYATQINERKSEAEALAGVRAVLEKTVARPPGAAEAFDAFLQGRGDVLLTYESEAIQAVEAGEGGRFQFIVPHRTILIENPIAVTEDGSGPEAEAFLEFVWSDEGQIILAEHGFRPANPRLVDQERFFPRHDAFRIERFGGWPAVQEEFFDEETGSIARIERELRRD